MLGVPIGGSWVMGTWDLSIPILILLVNLKLFQNKKIGEKMTFSFEIKVGGYNVFLSLFL